MIVKPEQLGPKSLAYLQEIDRTHGQSTTGAFIRKRDAEQPRAGWWWMVAIGVVLMVAVGYSFTFSIAEVTILPIAQAFLTAIGLGFLFAGIVRARRKLPACYLRPFLFADGANFWNVNTELIQIMPLNELRSTQGFHSSANGQYNHTTMHINFQNSPNIYVVYSKEKSEFFLNFLDLQQSIRNSDDEDVRLSTQLNPGRVAAWAVGFLRTKGADFTMPEVCPNPPELDISEAAEVIPSEPIRGGWVKRCALATALGVAAYFALGPVDRYLDDERRFAAIPKAITGNAGPHDDYLSKYPTGRHAAEVLESRDDQLFFAATRQSESNDSPSALRTYLGDLRNQRYRAEATEKIAVYYDRAIADLRERRKGKEKSIDPALFDAMIALLQSLKRSDTPIVTVGFQQTVDPLPKTDEQKEIEKLMRDARVKQEPRLEAIAQKQADSSPILPLGEVFSQEQIERREQVIFGRLQSAFQAAIKQDVLTFQEASEGVKPIFEVSYHVFPSGRLYLYSDRDTDTIKGLLRGYDIDWTITIRPSGDANSFVQKIKSAPLSKLDYDSRPGDPDWAVYAIIVYSSFYDLSAKLISGFALDPGKSPNAFSFDAVARNKSDEPKPPAFDPLQNMFPRPDPLEKFRFPKPMSDEELKNLFKLPPQPEFKMPDFKMPESPPVNPKKPGSVQPVPYPMPKSVLPFGQPIDPK